MEKIYTAHKGKNSQLIRKAASLYLKDGQTIADVTYGKGAFWADTSLENVTLLKSDIVTIPDAAYDFRSLPYDDCTIDHVVLDPPYMHTPGKPMVEERYQNAATTSKMYHADIIGLYTQGMLEARRVLNKGGHLWVKCQDEVQSGKQCWSHVELFNIATQAGFYGKDLFVLMSNNQPPIQHAQKHARKNHSYLWILEKRI